MKIAVKKNFPEFQLTLEVTVVVLQNYTPGPIF